MKYRLLSYPVHPEMPVYGSTPKPVLRKVQDMAAGGRCNTGFLEMSNHAGTHVDAPRHFIPDGRPISSYAAEELVFENPVLVEAPVEPGELISAEPFEKLAGEINKADLLLIRTGFHARRNEPVYFEANPGVSPEAAAFIRRNAPRLRAAGTDSISVSSFKHRDTGREVHGILLGPGENFSSPPLLLIEDMDLSGDLAGLTRVFLAPLVLAGMDAAPCTVIAEFDL